MAAQLTMVPSSITVYETSCSPAAVNGRRLPAGVLTETAPRGGTVFLNDIHAPAAVAAQGEIARNGGGKCAKRVDDEILHGIGERRVTREQRAIGGAELLHVEPEQPVERELVDFPEQTERNRKAERKERHEER